MRTLRAAATAACILAGLSGGQAMAAGKGPVFVGEPASLRVETAGVDFRNAASVEAFYAKLQRSALFVCGYSMDKDRAAQAKDRACADAALRDAVGAINRPTLTAMHQQSGAPMLARGW